MNQQIFPQSSYPASGDVQTQPGSPVFTVQGIQNTPFSSTKPDEGQVPVFDSNNNQWVPADPIVSGPDATGTTPTVNPVQVGGIDESDLVREIRTDSYGSLRLQRVEELLSVLISEVRAMKLAVIALDNTNTPTDYIAEKYLELDPVE